MSSRNIDEAWNLISDGRPQEALNIIVRNSDTQVDKDEDFLLDVTIAEAVSHMDIGLNLQYGEDEAIWHLEKGIELVESLPKDADPIQDGGVWLLFRVSDAYRYLGRPATAISALESALHNAKISEPNRRALLIRLLYLYLDEGRFDDAIEMGQAALRITQPYGPTDWGVNSDNEWAYCHAQISLAWTRKQRSDLAHDHLEAAKDSLNELHDDYVNSAFHVYEAEYWYLRAFVPSSELARIQAVNKLLQFVEVPQVRARYFVELGLAYFELDNFDIALEKFEQAIGEHPVSSIENHAHLFAGVAAYYLGQPRKSAEHLQLRFPNTLEPSEITMYELHRAAAFWESGKLRLAREAYERVLTSSEANKEQVKLARVKLDELKKS
jgi:tetratricopeptide (TPR) repeat protein